MKDIVIAVIALIIGVIVLCAGIYYLRKEKDDRESKKIYSVTAGIGALVTAAAVVRLLLLML